MYCPSWEEFQKLAESNEIIPVYKEISGDTETPVSLYKKVCSHSRYSFLLESAEKPGSIGRYSFIGFNPMRIFKSKGFKIELIEGSKTLQLSGNPLEILKSFLKKYKGTKQEGLPRFISGAVGYFSYDIIRFFENIPDNNIDDFNLPECYFIFVDTVLAVDHFNHTINIISNALTKGRSLKESYDEATHKIDQTLHKIKSSIKIYDFMDSSEKKEKWELESNTDQIKFEEAVRYAKEYIYQGDIFQAVLSQRFRAEIQSDPFNIYRALRRVNPSPYMYYLDYDGLRIIGSSPEVLVKAEDGIATIRPLAGTIKRGKTVDEDKELAKKLLNDSKERAEHIMLVDLARNDLGRICQYGTIKIPEKMEIDRFSHVMHIVSHVSGEIRKDIDQIEILKAAFPAGTVSGAPKIRAMEIIDELEPTKRGIYAGAVGYFDLFGNLDFCITIRTIVQSGGFAYIQAGAGIVYDSIPAKEYIETVNKAKALIHAIEMVEGKNYDFNY
ncbi:anthranilate synthase component I [candidate division KSB1 bacterium]